MHVMSFAHARKSVIVYMFRAPSTVRESSLSVTFSGEIAVDAGGVSRDLLSAFGEQAYEMYFDGSTPLRPVLHPQVRSDLWCTLGTALSRGYLVRGFLPTRIVFPSFIAILKGPQIQIPSDILRSSFVDYVSSVESSLLNEAVQTENCFNGDMRSRLNGLFFRFDCRNEPTLPK